ncbi:hypothetical protein OUZ56_011468 [Daphnia magna]|uniref:Uncharacterized protein n=1 Tax=Daphnia magna TaxID=35525 RepID=A0ABQ9Z098_9CRUS|nr:hypothetical protein OUZ56_011468 [Daphnia magna]
MYLESGTVYHGIPVETAGAKETFFNGSNKVFIRHSIQIQLHWVLKTDTLIRYQRIRFHFVNEIAYATFLLNTNSIRERTIIGLK